MWKDHSGLKAFSKRLYVASITVDSGYSHTKCFWEKRDFKRSVTICGVAKNRGISYRKS